MKNIYRLIAVTYIMDDSELTDLGISCAMALVQINVTIAQLIVSMDSHDEMLDESQFALALASL